MTTVSTVLVDNATLAGAGRALYAGTSGSLGAEHAKEYYSRYGLQAESDDRRSLFELVTALLLVDRLVWEGSSTLDPEATKEVAPNDPDGGKSVRDATGNEWLAWVYRWFPEFEALRKPKVLEPTYIANNTSRLKFAQAVAVKWVSTGKVDAAKAVGKIPLCYRKEDHPEREYVNAQQRAQQKYIRELSPDEVSLALFVARGVFYQACMRANDHEGYLPHSYRGALLEDPLLREAVDFCALGPFDTIPATEIIQCINETVYRRAAKVTATRLPDGKAVTLGAAFFRGTNTPLAAWTSAMEFRHSKEGEELRKHFGGLLQLAAMDDKARLDVELREVDKQLNEATLAVTGCSTDPPQEEKILLRTLLPFGLEGPLSSLIPNSWAEAIRKKLHSNLHRPSPYQMLFSSYLNGSRRSL